MEKKKDKLAATQAVTLRPDGEELPATVLYVAEGVEEDLGRYITLRQGSVTVGTSEHCELQLHDPRVSRRHVELATDNDGVFCRDLGSTNGTLYLGNRLAQAVLKHGAHLRLGKTVVALLPAADGVGIVPDEATAYGALVGVSSAIRRLFTILRRLESSEAPVLIQGETGTGKELVARTLHMEGRRKRGPFVVLDCGAIPRELVDSELFGHVRGAFSGAVADRAGLFEQADGGTLFLDEIGELPLELQPRLLRVLETGTTRRVGSNATTQVDVRVVAATHRDLAAAATAGKFRDDLFYRLAVVLLTVPPLRERLEDIPTLVRHLTAQISGDPEVLPDDVLNLMSGHDWPGNVRELRNAVHRLLSLGNLAPKTVSAATPGRGESGVVDASVPYKEAREQLLHRFEAAYIKAMLARHDGKIATAARSAGIARQYFKELMRKHDLYPEDDSQ